MLNELETIAEDVRNILLNDCFTNSLKLPILNEAAKLYPSYGGKAMRPALLLWSAGLFNETSIKDAINVAAAVEIFHIWTLVHDDIIDEDDSRRGGPSVHRFVEKSSPGAKSPEYFGIQTAILAGDVQQAWANNLILEASINDSLKLAILKRLNSMVNPLLISGEAIDVNFENRTLDDIDYCEIVEMLRLKTALLLRFAAESGAMIGLNETDPEQTQVKQLGDFAEAAGLAFQLQDDLLGTYADVEKLGKPVGSDLKQGKITCLFAKACELMSDLQRERFFKVYGNNKISDNDCQEIADIIDDCGARQAIKIEAEANIRNAQEILKHFPAGYYRDCLQGWADYIARRDK